MKSLDQLSLWQRIALAIGVVLFVLLALILISWWSDGQADAQTQSDELYADVASDPKLLALDKRALDEAYHDQIKHLWDIWIKGQARGVKEISNGLRLARSSYAVAAGQIAKREQQK